MLPPASGSPDPPERPVATRHPIGGEMADVLLGVFHRLRLSSLMRHYGSVPVLAVFSFVNGAISIALMAFVAIVFDAPFVFPSLGPTAFLFFYTPRVAAASPRNTLIGHLIGVVAGWVSLQIFGLADQGPALTTGVTASRALAAGLSLGLTAGLMVLARAPHPPAGATTLIVSLGILREPADLAVLMLAVVLLTVQAIVINRLAGVEYPYWSGPKSP